MSPASLVYIRLQVSQQQLVLLGFAADEHVKTLLATACAPRTCYPRSQSPLRRLKQSELLVYLQAEVRAQNPQKLGISKQALQDMW